jgi:hypothetical protein
LFILERCFVYLFDVGFVCGDWLRLRKMAKIIVAQPFYNRRYYHPRAVAAQARPASALAPPNLVGFVRAKSALGFDLGHPRVRFAKTGRFLTDRLFETGRVHATAAGSKTGLPVNNRKNTGDFSTERRVTDPRRRTYPAKTRLGSFGRNPSHGRRRGLVPLSMVASEHSLIAQHLSPVAAKVRVLF